MYFLILRPLFLKTEYHFFEGGMGGFKSFCLERSKQWGSLSLSQKIAGRMVTQPTQNFWSVVRILVGGDGGAVFTREGFEVITKKTPVSCITIRPLLGLRRKGAPLLGAACVTDKKTQTVCFCVTDCWPDCVSTSL